MQSTDKSTQKRRKIAGAVSALLIVALLLNSTLAWMDYDQHKSNRFSIDALSYSVTLNENFEEIKDWRPNAPEVTKEINVTNTGAKDGTYGDVFVRLQLKEFMQITPVRYLYSEKRYMAAMPDSKTAGEPKTSSFVDEINSFLNPDGTALPQSLAQYGTSGFENFITFETEQYAKDFINRAMQDPVWSERLGKGARAVTGYEAMGDVVRDANNTPVLDATGSAVPIKRYYIETLAGDPNGQYGKYVPLGVQRLPDETEIITSRGNSTPPSAAADAKDKHNDGTLNCLEWHEQNDAWEKVNGEETCASDKTAALHANGECSYLPHLWGSQSPGVCDLEAHRYIQWVLNQNAVITVEQWEAGYSGKPVKKWIIDTRSEEGWVYWGTALTPGETTPNFLEKVRLAQQPDGRAEYIIHTEMEAVDLKRLGNWQSDIANAIAKQPQITIAPFLATLAPGEGQSFTYTLLNAEATGEVTWQVKGGNGSSSAPAGKLTVGATEENGTVLNVIATHTESGKISVATVTVKIPEP